MFRAMYKGRMVDGSGDMQFTGPTGIKTPRQSILAIRELSQQVLMKINENEIFDNTMKPQTQNLVRYRSDELRKFISTHPARNEEGLRFGAVNLPRTDPQLAFMLSPASQYPREVRHGSGPQPKLADVAGKEPMNDELNPLKRHHAPPGINTLRYKTELCRSVSEGDGSCRYGDKCQYAHSKEEQRHVPKHPRYKTELCREYHITSICSYGLRCNFIHDEYKKNHSSNWSVGAIGSRSRCFGSGGDLSSLQCEGSRSPSPEENNTGFQPFGSAYGGYMNLQESAMESKPNNGARAQHMENAFQFAQPYAQGHSEHKAPAYM